MLFRYVPDYRDSIYLSEFIVSSSTKKSLQNLMEKSILFRFNIEILGNTSPVSSATNPSCQSICGILLRNIIVRVFSKSNFSTNQTLRRHGGMLTSVPILLSQETTRLMSFFLPSPNFLRQIHTRIAMYCSTSG